MWRTDGKLVAYSSSGTYMPRWRMYRGELTLYHKGCSKLGCVETYFIDSHSGCMEAYLDDNHFECMDVNIDDNCPRFMETHLDDTFFWMHGSAF